MAGSPAGHDECRTVAALIRVARPQAKRYLSAACRNLGGGPSCIVLWPSGSGFPMNSFELNKVLGAILGTSLIVLALNIGAGADIEREHDQTGAEDGAEDLVEFEGIHRKAAPGRPQDDAGWASAEVAAGSRQIPFCLGSGNPYKRGDR